MLKDARLVSLMLYVNDLALSRAFYERSLGFRVLEEDESSVKYSAGRLVLCLHKTSDYGVSLSAPRNYSAGITFLVDDLEGMRAALERRGVKFALTLNYKVGARADFYDPDGHWLSLYEPSEEAMLWPSGEKIREFRGAGGDGAARQTQTARAAAANLSAADYRLDGKDIIYLFLFVRDAGESFRFYHDILNLRNIEGGPCKRGSTLEVDGVVKYDVGGTLLTTHHVGDHARAGLEFRVSDMKGMAPVFRVVDLRRAADELTSNGVRCSLGPDPRFGGPTAKFEDPFGRVFYMYQPSEEVQGRDCAVKAVRVPAAPV